MICSSIISWNFGEKISELPPKLKIWQTIFQNPKYITFFGIFSEKWNNIVFMYLILLEMLSSNMVSDLMCDKRFSCNSSECVILEHFETFCSKMTHSELLQENRWSHIKSETIFGISIKFPREWDTWRLYYFIFWKKFQKMWYM